MQDVNNVPLFIFMEKIIKVFAGIGECAAVTDITEETLLVAREHVKRLPMEQCKTLTGTNGFADGGRIYWTPQLEEYINTHLEEFENVDDQTLQHWRLRKMRASALKEELELEEKYKRIVNKDSVNQLLDRISTAQVSLFNGKLRQELPARLNLPPDKVGEIDKIITELFAVMAKGIAQWQ